MSKFERGKSLLLPFVALFLLLAGCKGQGEQATREPGAKEEAPPALAKLQGDPAQTPATPEAAPKSARDGAAEKLSAEAPPEGDDDSDSDSDSDSEPTRRARRSAKQSPVRNRATSREVDAPANDSEGTKSAKPLTVKRILFAHKIEGREPVDPEETFDRTDADKLYAFIELTNEAKKKSKIVVSFIPPSGKQSKVTLDVGDKSRWRTWALRRNAKQAGTWQVLVHDENGQQIGRRTFEVTE